jgi:hypothetical protein
MRVPTTVSGAFQRRETIEAASACTLLPRSKCRFTPATIQSTEGSYHANGSTGYLPLRKVRQDDEGGFGAKAAELLRRADEENRRMRPPSALKGECLAGVI